jgi:hypothetical protein
MINQSVVDSQIIGSPTTQVGNFELFGDGSVSGSFNASTLVLDGSMSITANSVISNSGDVKVVDNFHCDDYRAATYHITVDGFSGSVKRCLFTTFYVLQDEDDVYTTEQGTLFNRNLGTFSANLDTSKTASTTNIVNLLFTPTTSEKLTIKFVRTGLFK